MRKYFISFILDIISIFYGILLSYFLRFGYPIPEFELINFSFIVPSFVLASFIIFKYNRIFEINFKILQNEHIVKIFYSTLTASFLTIAINFFIHKTGHSRLIFIYMWIITGVFCIFWRILLSKLLSRDANKVLIVSSSESENILEYLREIDYYKRSTIDFLRLDKLDFYKLEDYIVKKNYDEVIFYKIIDPNKEIIEFNEKCLKMNCSVKIIPDYFNLFLINSKIENYGQLILLIPETDKQLKNRLFFKYIFDYIFSIIMLILTFPLMIIIGILILISDGRPIIYTQDRIGERGKFFKMYKFRTMKKNSEKQGSLLVEDESDPRITSVGRFLRKYSLDEILQFFNVLKGDMSVVGPRPEIPEIVKNYTSIQREVLKIKPGITGLVQVLGRDLLSEEEKFKYDLFYLYNFTLLMDLKIILNTVKAVITGYGSK